MSTHDLNNSNETENLCVVCFKNVEIYSIGVCDHPVCFECSTRMRVLCKQKECPICRQDMPKVIFTKTVEPFRPLFIIYERSNMHDAEYGMIFCTSDIQKAYLKLLEHKCHICDDRGRRLMFKKFVQLEHHMRREHLLFYCELCVDNLNIFSSERRCYTREELAQHRRKGDPDNTSHRGHPLCEFCDHRYVDTDDLFRHLRRQHFFCHFCDADGKYQYYSSVADLTQHFLNEHFLCQEGECKDEPLIAAFRTEIDLKVHLTTKHSRLMSKSANKQARTLELEFTLAPRVRQDARRQANYGRNSRMDEEGAVGYSVEPGGPPEPTAETFVNPIKPQDFPALGNSTAPVRPTTTVNFTSKINPQLNRNDFPSLGGTKATANNRSSNLTITTNSSLYSNRPSEVTISRTLRGQNPSNKREFPPLGGGSTSSASGSVRLSVNNNSQESKAPNVSIQVKHKANGAITTHITATPSSTNPLQAKPTEAFPALGRPSSAQSQPQWVQQKSKKRDSKVAKVAPAPQLPPTDLAQFPKLNKAKKTSSVTVPVSNNWAESSNNKSDSKTKKTSNNIKSVEQKMQDLSTKTKKKKKTVDTNETSSTAQSHVTNNNIINEQNMNGTIKKRSELKIGTLKSPSEELPDQNAKPPPGFSVKPPPGFSGGNAASFPALGGASNDLTFTNSTGQSYSIIPSQIYRQPSNFQARNQNLVKKLENSAAIIEFKKYSTLFRNGVLTAAKYYEHCQAFLGVMFEEVFPELLVLLPDIEKQQELYVVYQGLYKRNLVVCENCKQVLYKRELSDHYSYHALDNHFPSLGKATEVNTAWKK